MSDQKEGIRLYRSSKDRIVAGVCGGLAETYKWDPALVRLVFVILIFVQGSGILLYLVLWIVMPLWPGENSASAASRTEKLKGFIEDVSEEFNNIVEEAKEVKIKRAGQRDLAAVIIILIGLVALAGAFFPMRWLSAEILWPVILIFIGLYLIAGKR